MLEIRDFHDFSILNWYEKFQHVTLKTVLVKLPKELINRIQDEESETISETDCTNEFKEEIENALNVFDKKTFVKNNWHAPTDARVFSFGNNLQACSLSDILLYFASSVIIQEDFDVAKTVPFCLAVKKWVNLHPAAEFRCIVINNLLLGITPRDWPTYYAHFKDEGPQIIQELTSFYNENIEHKFVRSTYIFDVVYSYPDKPYLLDFGPLNNKTNLYAFTWKEIQAILNKQYPNNIAPVFRYLENDIGIMTRNDAMSIFERSRISFQ